MKNLPIHMVKFRDHTDEFLTEGMGDRKEPKWMTPEAIRKNAARVLSEMDLFNAYFAQREQEKKSLPILTVVKLHEDATAKSHRKDVRAMFDIKGKRNVIGMAGQDELVVKIDNASDLREMRSKFAQVNSNLIDAKFELRKAIAAVEDMRQYTPIVDFDLDGKTVKVKLADYLNADLNDKRDKEFRSFCSEQGLQFKEVYYSDKMKIFRIDNLPKDKIIALATMDSVISVREMPYILLTASPELTDTTIAVKNPDPKGDYPVVGLLDSGTANIPHLTPWVMEDNIANFDEQDITREHGTFVAGIMLYGDDLERKPYTNSMPFRIQSCIVNSKRQRIYEEELIGLIVDSINKYPEIKVWNLSQGSEIEVDDNHFSDFAIALDELQDKYKIIICKSSGNQDNPASGQIRITQGAESIRSLVVGSIASQKLEPLDAEIDCRSPFSRIGFGPENLIKPDLVHYGGNMSPFAGVRSFSIYGNEAILSGTSFSTARVTALAATIAYQLGAAYNPLLVKALLINSASYPLASRLIGEERYKELGYGLPQDAGSILFNDEDEFTMVFNVLLEKGTDVWALDFPYPNCLVGDDGLYYGDITVTMVSNPLLNPNEGTEYCQSNVDVLLQTFDRTERSILGANSTPKTYRNELRPKETQNVLAKDRYSKRLTRNFDLEFTKERTLIEEYLKYQPIKKYHVNLDEMTPANRQKCLPSNRRWAIKLQSLYRDCAELDMNCDGIHLATEVCLIVTIKDPQKKGRVYNEGVELLRAYNYQYNTLSLRQEVRIQ